MFDIYGFLLCLIFILSCAVITWGLSLALNNVAIVDSLWPLLFIVAAFSYASGLDQPELRSYMVLVLVTAWGIRLFLYLSWRGWGADEDYRYQNIRKNNEPNFWIKSLYLVFGVQGVSAWIISLPLMAAVTGNTEFGFLDWLGLGVWTIGFGFESLGDCQLARFRRNPENKNRVLQSGLWQYTRHPNYFGDFCVWWGFYLIALSAGGWWSIFSPIFMTALLLKITGVLLLEKDIGNRRPEYVSYINHTNAFFPWPRKQSKNL